MRPPNQSDRLAEVRGQLTYVQKDRHVRVDLPAVRAAASGELWHAQFQPHNDPPMHLVPRTKAGAVVVATDVALHPLTEWPALIRTARKRRSLATALEKLPARLFALSTKGLLVGAQAVLALACVGVSSSANLIV